MARHLSYGEQMPMSLSRGVSSLNAGNSQEGLRGKRGISLGFQRSQDEFPCNAKWPRIDTDIHG